jgi:hypothetical protein
MTRIGQSKKGTIENIEHRRFYRSPNGAWTVNEIFCSHCVYATCRVSSVSIRELLGLFIKVTALLISCLCDFAWNVHIHGNVYVVIVILEYSSQVYESLD